MKKINTCRCTHTRHMARLIFKEKTPAWSMEIRRLALEHENKETRQTGTLREVKHPSIVFFPLLSREKKIKS